MVNNWFEEDKVKEDETSDRKKILQEFIDNWTAHGFVRVFRNGGIARRLAWLLICLIFLGYSGYLSVSVIIEFFNYPKSIAITQEGKTVAQFPGVTICNLNPISKYKDELINNSIWGRFLELEQDDNSTTDCAELKYDDGNYILLSTDLAAEMEAIDDYDDDDVDYGNDDDYDDEYDDEYSGYYYYGGSGSGSESGSDSGFESGSGSGFESGSGSSSGSGSGRGSRSNSEETAELHTSGIHRTLYSSNSFSEFKKQAKVAFDDYDHFDSSENEAIGRTASIDKGNIDDFPHYLNKYENMTKAEITSHRRNCSNVYTALAFMNSKEEDAKLDLDKKKCAIGDFNETVMFSPACKTDVIYDVFGAYLRDLTEYKEFRVENDTNDPAFVKSNCPGSGGESFPVWRFLLEDGLTAETLKDILSNSRTTDMSDVIKIYHPTAEEIKKHSLPKREFILSCSFDNQPCSFKDFYEWRSDSLGKCFTFNSKYRNDGKVKKPRFTPLKGPSSGLKITLDLNTKEQLSLLSPDVGVRLITHPYDEMPFPEDEGINISPGLTTSVAINKKIIERIGVPYGVCNERDHYYKDLDLFYKFSYTYMTCQKLCLEQTIRKWCGCKFSTGPMYAILDKQYKIFGGLKKCFVFNYQQKYCIEAVQYSYRRGIGIECECNPACHETRYQPTIALTQSNHNYYRVLKDVKKIKTGEDVCSSTGKNETVRLQVYLDSLQYELIKESPAYTFSSFLSNMGGSLGLFLGFSIISLCELLELIFDLIYASCCKKKKTV